MGERPSSGSEEVAILLQQVLKDIATGKITPEDIEKARKEIERANHEGWEDKMSNSLDVRIAPDWPGNE